MDVDCGDKDFSGDENSSIPMNKGIVSSDINDYCCGTVAVIDIRGIALLTLLIIFSFNTIYLSSNLTQALHTNLYFIV